MTALNFPTSPSNGDTYSGYVYNATKGVWVLSGTSSAASNSFTTIAVPSGTSPVADTPEDTLTFSAGTGITITGDSISDTVTISSSSSGLETTFLLMGA